MSTWLKNLSNSKAILMLFTISLALILFSLGIEGAFLFDDTANLPAILQVTDWQSFIEYAFSGISGPTGRPVSLISFMLTADAWPGHPEIFLAGNIILHLVNICLVYWLTHQLSLMSSFTNKQAFTCAILTSAIWAILPNHVSTVLYVIQRMTLLATTFGLFSLIMLIYALTTDNKKIFSKYSIASIISIGLAILSKENAAIIFVIAYFIVSFFAGNDSKLRQETKSQRYFWSSLSLILLAYLSTHIINAEQYYSNRPFSLSERVFTQFELFITHFSNFLFPRPVTNSLFNDQIAVVSSVSDYLTSGFIGLLILSSCIYAFTRVYQQRCLVSFWILFFFAGHLIESTVIALDLYYEHRNYLPFIGLSAALATLSVKVAAQYRKYLTIGIALFLIANIYATFSRASLWGNPFKAAAYWAELNPKSLRAQENAAVQFSKTSNLEAAIIYLKRAYAIEPSPFITLNAINLACKKKGKVYGLLFNPNAFKDNLKSNRDFPVAMETLALLKQGKCDDYTPNQLLEMSNNILANPEYASNSIQQKFLHIKAELEFILDQQEAGLTSFQQSLDKVPSYDALILQAATIANFGHCKDALNYLHSNKNLELKLSLRESIVDSLYPRKNILIEYIEQLEAVCVNEKPTS
ncbi:hypothetical protein ACUR5C_06335 [Aliikangiella sp. IMCC44653]